MNTTTMSRKPVVAYGHTYAKDYDPKPLKRRVDLVWVSAEMVASFRAYSWRTPGRETRYELRVDLRGGGCSCTCPDYQRHHRGSTVWDGDEHHCKHLVMALQTLARRGLLPQQHGVHTPICIKCGAVDADDYYVAYDERGNEPVGRICCDCAAGELPVNAPEAEAPEEDAPEPEPDFTARMKAYNAAQDWSNIFDD